MAASIEDYLATFRAQLDRDMRKLRDHLINVRVQTLDQAPEVYTKAVVEAAKNYFNSNLTRIFKDYSTFKTRPGVRVNELRDRTVEEFARVRAAIMKSINIDRLSLLAPEAVEKMTIEIDRKRDLLIRHIDEEFASVEEHSKAEDFVSATTITEIGNDVREAVGSVTGVGTATAVGASIAAASGTATASRAREATSPAATGRSAATSIGVAVLQNQESLKPLLTSLTLLIDAKLAELRQANPASNSEIAQYDDIRVKLQALIEASDKFIENEASEAEPPVATAAMSFSEGVKKWWASRHEAILDRGFGIVAGGSEAGIFLGTLGVCIMLKVPPELAAIISGAVLPQGQKVIDAIKAFLPNKNKTP